MPTNFFILKRKIESQLPNFTGNVLKMLNINIQSHPIWEHEDLYKLWHGGVLERKSTPM